MSSIINKTMVSWCVSSMERLRSPLHRSLGYLCSGVSLVLASLVRSLLPGSLVVRGWVDSLTDVFLFMLRPFRRLASSSDAVLTDLAIVSCDYVLFSMRFSDSVISSLRTKSSRSISQE